MSVITRDVPGRLWGPSGLTTLMGIQSIQRLNEGLLTMEG